jgi:hypothetical protein
MTSFIARPTVVQIASIQSMLSGLVPGLGREGLEADTRKLQPQADRLVGASESRVLFMTATGPGYLYRRREDHAGLFHLILRPDRFRLPNFEIADDAAPSARLISLHFLEESTDLPATRHFVALAAIAKAACRDREFFELKSDPEDPVFRLLALFAGASDVFDEPREMSLRDQLSRLKRTVEDRVLDFLVEKIGLE